MLKHNRLFINISSRWLGYSAPMLAHRYIPRLCKRINKSIFNKNIKLEDRVSGLT